MTFKRKWSYTYAYESSRKFILAHRANVGKANHSSESLVPGRSRHEANKLR